MADEIYYAPGTVTEEHGVLWMMHPTESDPEPGLRLYGSWHKNITDALADLDKAADNPRCAYAAVFTRSTALWSRTGNAVDRRAKSDGQT